MIHKIEAVHYKIEELTDSDRPERGRQHATGNFVPARTEPYGARRTGVNPKKRDEESQTYLLRPSVVLEPGYYAVTSSNGVFSHAGSSGYGYTFRVSAAETSTGSAPPPSRVAVEASASAPAPPTGTALVTIESLPGNAEVSVDGDLIGTTPLIGYRMGAGARRIVVTKKAYAPWIRELKVAAGVDTRLAAELEPDPNVSPARR